MIYVYMCMCACICTSMRSYTCACVCVCIFVHSCGSWYQCFSVWTVSCMRTRFRVHMHAYTYVCRYEYMCIFFAVSVTFTLQVLWALVHGRVCMLHRCVFTPTYASATRSLKVVHICVWVYMCVYACICIWMRMCVYDIA